MPRNKYHQKHLDSGRELPPLMAGGTMVRRVAICGFEASWRDNVTTDESLVNCPTCSGLIGARALAARPKGEPSLKLLKSTDHVGGGYRFTYKAMLAGVHVGWIVYEGAYGRASWKVCVINLPRVTERLDGRKDTDRRTVGYQLDADPESPRDRPLTFMSKEQALLAIPELRAGGRLPTLPELEAQHEAAQVREARWQVERRQERERWAEDVETMKAAIESLLERPTDELTNLERAGVLLLKARITKLTKGEG